MSARKVHYDHPAATPEDSQLIADLIALSKKSPKLVKSSVYPAPSNLNTSVRSWKMNEHKYYDIPSPFPTYARGLFTIEMQSKNSTESRQDAVAASATTRDRDDDTSDVTPPATPEGEDSHDTPTPNLNATITTPTTGTTAAAYPESTITTTTASYEGEDSYNTTGTASATHEDEDSHDNTITSTSTKQEIIPAPTTKKSSSHSHHRIVARGYDKFFNIGEVPWTEWSALELHTRAPYILSLKSNGCIIFIAALTSSQLLITSKHSLGPVQGQPLSHAEAGAGWLRRYLEEKNRTEADLAKKLWDNNWTAIAELCDDSFEEHVLPYPPERTGLYLHGINTCTKAFHTLPPETVDAFAQEWGFIKTRCITLPTLTAVREFTDEVRKTGKWENEPIEGFVVRTHVSAPPLSSNAPITSMTTEIKSQSQPQSKKQGMIPYSPGSTFFFKIKFDEPYMMYRDWREVTKTLLSRNAKGMKMSPADLPRSKMQRPETRAYVDWVIKEIKTNPKAFDSYMKGKGIIATRERFLSWLDNKEDIDKAQKKERSDGKEVGKKKEREEKEEKKDSNEIVKTIIVPIAVPGCGKTAVSVALAHIFGFGHTQSDDVRAKKPGPVFVRNVMNLLEHFDVVIADKNNHLKQHREALREAANALVAATSKAQNKNKKPTKAERKKLKRQQKMERERGRADKENKENVNVNEEDQVESENEGEELKPLASPQLRVRLVAMHWNVYSYTPAFVFNVCANRVRVRGENHQTLRAAPDALPVKHEDITAGTGEAYGEVVWSFIRGTQELAPSEVDAVIEMEIKEDGELDEGVRLAVEGVVRELGLELPSEERVKEGIALAMGYKVPEEDKRETGSSPPAARKKYEDERNKKERAKGKPLRYFGFKPEVDLENVLDPVFERAEEEELGRKMWREMKKGGRVAPSPHVTIVHQKEVEDGADGDAKALWGLCEELVGLGKDTAEGEDKNKDVEFWMRLSHVLWDGRVMALAVESVESVNEGGERFVKGMTERQKERLHVTVGTKDSGVKPVEALEMVRKWRRSAADGDVSNARMGVLPIGEQVKVKARVRGLYS